MSATETIISGTSPIPGKASLDCARERVFATVMFIDIVGSTGRAWELGDRRWKELLDRYEAIVGSQLDRFGGRGVKATGDGTLATFDGISRAVRCAGAVQDSIVRTGLRVRIGIHAGEVEPRGQDIAGIAVHIAQRVQSAAEPGEVLVSRTVVDLSAGSGLRFQDRGDHNLKGVPGKWRLFSMGGRRPRRGRPAGTPPPDRHACPVRDNRHLLESPLRCQVHVAQEAWRHRVGAGR